jgi:hypothetical protein
MYGLTRHELMLVVTFTLPWAVELRNSYDSISNMGGFLESDLVVLTNSLNQDLFDYIGPNIDLVLSCVDNAAASATKLTSLLRPTPDFFTRSGDSGGRIRRIISQIPLARPTLAFCIPSPPD